VDEAALSSAVDQIAARVDRQPRDARLVFDPGVAIEPAVTGRTLDRSRARDAIRTYLESHLFQPSDDPLALDVTTTPPAVADAQLAPLGDQAQRLLAQSVVFTDGHQTWPIPSDALRSALIVTGSPPHLGVRPGAFDATLDALDRLVGQPPRDARIVVTQGKVQIQGDQPGQAVDRAATLRALDDGIARGNPTIPVTLTTADAKVKTADLQKVAADTQALLNQGLALTADGQSYPVSAGQLGDLVVIRAPGTTVADVTLDPAKVANLVSQINQKFEQPTPDARFGWDNGKVVVLSPVVPARAIDQKKATQVILQKWQTGTVELPVVATSIKVDDALVARLNADLKGVIAERSISYVGSIPERARNVALALSKINGSLVMPGQTFSFDRELGPPTLAAGFQWGFAYSSGADGQSQVVPAVAGGICQAATSVFQPVFWTGYQIDERHWHMFPMHSYADQGYLGLDATVAPEDGVDFQWTNDTDHAVLIKSWGDGSFTHVQLISTQPSWTVKVSPEVITDIVPAPTQAVRTMSPHFTAGRQIVLEEAQDGLTSHVTRQVIYPDGHVRTLNLSSVYQPSPLSILVGTG
jgi:vancomycin resistance protein YoaR